MKKIVRLLLSLSLVCCIACSISYKFNGSTIDYTKIKTISVAYFPIKAPLVYPPLAAAFNEALKDTYTRQTRLSVVDNNGNLQIQGEITGYDLSPQAVTADAYASKTRLTVRVKVRYKNTVDSSQNIDQTFSAYRDFSSSELLTNVQDELVKQIVEELADLIFNATVANW